MTARKSERLLNLLITLLVSRTYVTKDRIRAVVEPYREARRRGLREDVRAGQGGAPLARHPDRGRLRRPLLRGRARLPDRAVRLRAARDRPRAARRPPSSGWRPGSGSTPGWPPPPPTRWSSSRRPGVTVDRAALDVVQPQLTAEEPAFEPLWDATRTAPRCGSTTAAPGAPAPATRHLQPWGVVSYRGRWYVVGHDTDRGEPRMFRLSRVQGDGQRRRARRLLRRARRAPTCAR